MYRRSVASSIEVWFCGSDPTNAGCDLARFSLISIGAGVKISSGDEICTRHQNATPVHLINLSLNFSVGHYGSSSNMDADGDVEMKAKVCKEKIG